MNTPQPDDQIARRARQRVEQKLGLGTHALVYVLVNAALLAVNWVHDGDRWHVWPLGGWGLGLAVHGLVTILDLRGDGLRARLLAAEIERLGGRR